MGVNVAACSQYDYVECPVNLESDVAALRVQGRSAWRMQT